MNTTVDKKKIRVGDFVRAKHDCGETKKGIVYEVILDDMNGTGKPCSPKLAINPILHSKTHHEACTEIDTWEFVKRPNKKNKKELRKLFNL